MKKSASCKSPMREANISDREGTGMGQNVHRRSMCEKGKNIRNEANRKNFSKYVFFNFMASEAISGKKAEKIAAK